MVLMERRGRRDQQVQKAIPERKASKDRLARTVLCRDRRVIRAIRVIPASKGRKVLLA
jgi:hypothetical protein